MLEWIVDALMALGHKIEYVDPGFVRTASGVDVEWDATTKTLAAEWSPCKGKCEGVTGKLLKEEWAIDLLKNSVNATFVYGR